MSKRLTSFADWPSSIATPPRPDAAAEKVEWTRLSDVTPEKISWLWDSRLARGKMSLFAGDPGLGKSRLAFDIASRITTGATWPDGSGRAPKGSVMFLIGEDGLGDTVRPAIEAMGGNPDAVYFPDIRVRRGDYLRPVDLAADLQHVEAALEDLGPQLMVVDPITAFIGRTDSYKDSEVRGLLTPLLKVVERHHVALLAIAHLNKSQQRSALYRVGGSIGFIAAARLAFLVAADPEDDDVRVLRPLKANICKPAPGLAFRLPDGCIQWQQGTVDISAETLLGSPAQAKNHPALDEATDFLSTILADGSVDSDRIFREGAAQGISYDTMRRAKDALGVKAHKQGLGPWMWTLPSHTSASSASSAPSEKAVESSLVVDTHIQRHVRAFEDADQDLKMRTGTEDADDVDRTQTAKPAHSVEDAEDAEDGYHT